MSKFLVTGGAGFIGSEIVNKLIEDGHDVVVVDDLSTGHLENLNSVLDNKHLRFIKGSVTDFNLCLQESVGMDYIIHQAALVSVPKSTEVPIENHERNITGFLNILECMRINKIKKLVYASSSAVYGDDSLQIKEENKIGNSLSPYALSKYVDELYAKLYARLYGVKSIGLRYFNVYGAKQDPSSPYSGVISVFFARLMKGLDINIYGDGQVERDFINVADVARANVLACFSEIDNEVYNVGTGIKTNILELAEMIMKITNSMNKINFLPPRIGDIKYSCSNSQKIKRDLGFVYEIDLYAGLEEIYCIKNKEKC